MVILVALLLISIIASQIPVETKTLIRRVGFLAGGDTCCVGTYIRIQAGKKK